MTTEDLLDFDEKLTEYFDIITGKLHAGKIDISKFDKLAGKIDEWYNEAGRKAAIR